MTDSDEDEEARDPPPRRQLQRQQSNSRRGSMSRQSGFRVKPSNAANVKQVLDTMPCSRWDRYLSSSFTKKKRQHDRQRQTIRQQKQFRIQRSEQNELIVGFLSYLLTRSFKASYMAVALLSFIGFMFFTCVFAGLIYAIFHHQPDCIFFFHPDNSEFTFIDAYQLSWTTFSTVGYGVVHPHVFQNGCMWLNAFMAFESFLGVIFASFCGAMIVAKVARSHSAAQVQFCDPLCVRYGSGVMRTANNCVKETIEDAMQSSEELEEESHVPCPILEFRIANEYSSYKNGVIVDASVKVLACLLARDDPALKVRNSIERDHHHIGNLRSIAYHASRVFHPHRVDSTTDRGRLPSVSEGTQHHFTPPEHNKFSRVASPRSVFVNEGDSELAPSRKYHSLKLESDRHPYFSRVWIVRHFLDENSPLLDDGCRRQIKLNDGYWPYLMDDHKAVRDHIQFNDLIVSFSGISSASGKTVYSQKVYDYADLHVGWSFSEILFLNRGRVDVDLELLHDVRRQNGGGAEPLWAGQRVDNAEKEKDEQQEEDEQGKA